MLKGGYDSEGSGLHTRSACEYTLKPGRLLLVGVKGRPR